jgi:hypothetical protein
MRRRGALRFLDQEVQRLVELKLELMRRPGPNARKLEAVDEDILVLRAAAGVLEARRP